MNKTFRPGHSNYNACVGFNGFSPEDNFLHEKYLIYSHGYEESVNILLSEALKLKATIDIIVYPIIYTARHRIELFLKHQIFELGIINKALDSKHTTELKKTHNLATLWEEFKKLAENENRYSGYITQIDEYISDFHEIDVDGEVFRYPYSEDDQMNLSDIHCIGISNFSERWGILNNLMHKIEALTTILVYEYSQGSVIKNRNISRQIIKQIAQELPHTKEWVDQQFDNMKDNIKKKYSISSRALSDVINFIKKHREFSLLIGIEIPIEHISIRSLNSYIKIFYEFRHHIETSNYFDSLDIYTYRLCDKLNKSELASLAQLYDIGFFGLYSEEYDSGYQYKMKKYKKRDLVFDHLLSNRHVITNIKKGLRITGQRALLNSLVETN